MQLMEIFSVIMRCRYQKLSGRWRVIRVSAVFTFTVWNSGSGSGSRCKLELIKALNQLL